MLILQHPHAHSHGISVITHPQLALHHAHARVLGCSNTRADVGNHAAHKPSYAGLGVLHTNRICLNAALQALAP